MFFWNRCKQERQAQIAEQSRQQIKTRQDTEQLRLGTILFNTLRQIAEQNKQVCGGTISAECLERNAGNYSVVIKYLSGNRRESMMQFNINLARNRLTTTWKYSDGPKFTTDEFDQFVDAASQMVRDFR